LDAHDPTTPDRGPEGIALVDGLDQSGLAAYVETSRSGRGCHVWLFFDAPGAPARDLHKFLDALASVLRRQGRVDLFPNSPSGKGGAVWLPYFGGAMNLLDADLEAIHWDDLHTNPATAIPPGRTPARWPPPYFSLAGGQASKAAPYRAQLAAWASEGVAFKRGGVWQARRGCRNLVAGGIARDLVRHGKTFEDFVTWDTANEPPLATDRDERRALHHWWRSAQRQEERACATSTKQAQD
jgi:hypothetical protein